MHCVEIKLLLQSSDDGIGRILFNDVLVVKHIEFFCGISSSVDENRLLTAYIREKLGKSFLLLD